MRTAPAARASSSAAASSAAASPRPRALVPHAETRELRGAARLDQQAARAEHLAVDRHQLQRLGVAPVLVAVEPDALLAAEDLLAQREGGGELLLVAGPADLHQDR